MYQGNIVGQFVPNTSSIGVAMSAQQAVCYNNSERAALILPPAPIRAGLDARSAQAATLHDMISQFENRLMPVLRPANLVGPQDSANACRPLQSPIADQLEQIGSACAAALERLQGLIDRLEV